MWQSYASGAVIICSWLFFVYCCLALAKKIAEDDSTEKKDGPWIAGKVVARQQQIEKENKK